jgi:ketosteroid isomerase-like protein
MSEVVDGLITALNAHDLEAAAELMHEDYHSEQPAHPGRAFVGRAQMHANWKAILEGIPDFHAELIRSIDDDDTTWSEWSWSGHRVEGEDVQVRGVTLFKVRDGKIASGRLYMEDVERSSSIEADVESMSGQRPDDL